MVEVFNQITAQFSEITKINENQTASTEELISDIQSHLGSVHQIHEAIEQIDQSTSNLSLIAAQ